MNNSLKKNESNILIEQCLEEFQKYGYIYTQKLNVSFTEDAIIKILNKFTEEIKNINVYKGDFDVDKSIELRKNNPKFCKILDEILLMIKELNVLDDRNAGVINNISENMKVINNIENLIQKISLEKPREKNEYFVNKIPIEDMDSYYEYFSNKLKELIVKYPKIQTRIDDIKRLFQH